LFTHTLTHTHTHSPRNCCHRGVLVERTVKEVKPAVEENKERIGQVRLSATSPSRSTHRPWCTEVTKAAQRGHDTLNHCVPPTCHTLSRQNHHHTPWALTRNPNPRAPVGPPPPPTHAHTRTHTHTHTHNHHHHVKVIGMLKRQLGDKLKSLEVFKEKYGVQQGGGGDDGDEPEGKKGGAAAPKSAGVLV
jgi:hypothetical protein